MFGPGDSPNTWLDGFNSLMEISTWMKGKLQSSEPHISFLPISTPSHHPNTLSPTSLCLLMKPVLKPLIPSSPMAPVSQLLSSPIIQPASLLCVCSHPLELYPRICCHLDEEKTGFLNQVDLALNPSLPLLGVEPLTNSLLSS